MKKRLLSTLLALCMALALLPATALAADSDFVIENGVLVRYMGPGGAVTIPSGVTEIGPEAFAVRDDVTSVTIPSSVTSVGPLAFIACQSLTSMTFPGSVTYIGEGAFIECINLTSLTIPGSVTYIGVDAFNGCPALADVYYGGSESQWKEVCFDYHYLDDMGTVIHYNSASSNPPAEPEPPAAPKGITVTVGGNAVAWTDAEPFIDSNSRTMVPLRAVADAMDLTVDWDGSARVASFSNGEKTIAFPIGSNTAETSDGNAVQMDTAAVIKDNRTYAPIRYLAEYFGYEVGWDGATKTVSIK